jgi:hypothetical protein
MLLEALLIGGVVARYKRAGERTQFSGARKCLLLWRAKSDESGHWHEMISLLPRRWFRAPENNHLPINGNR